MLQFEVNKIMFKKLRKFYKNNRIYCILMIISILCILVMGVSVVVYFFNQMFTDSYGSRLENIEKYDLGNSLTDLENFYKSQEGVMEVSVRLQGKIIYLDVKVAETMKNEQIQTIATTRLDNISEANRGFYDIQFMFTREGLNPYLGAKNSGNTVIVWTNYTYDIETTTEQTKK